MTPQLQQAIRLLQLPVLELQAQIREALETNVMLESEDEAGSLETGDTVVEPKFEITAPAHRAETVETASQEARRRTIPTVKLDNGIGSDRGPVKITHRTSPTPVAKRAGTSDLATGDVAAQRTRHAYRRSDHRCHNDDGSPSSHGRIASKPATRNHRGVAVLERSCSTCRRWTRGRGGARSANASRLERAQLDSDTPGRGRALLIGRVISIRSPISNIHRRDASCVYPKTNLNTRWYGRARASRGRVQRSFRARENIVPRRVVRWTERGGWAVDMIRRVRPGSA